MANCSNWPIGFTPINDLGQSSYQGFQGGLYPGGRNASPPSHDAIGESIAKHIDPLNLAGIRDTVAGKIVFALIGPSWINLVAPHFDAVAAEHANLLHPSLQIVNLGRGGKTIVELADPNDGYWTTWVPNTLAGAGLSTAQVQAGWILEGERDMPGVFPASAQKSQLYWEAAIANARAVLPNLKMLWLSPPAYMGYAQPPLSVGEPSYGEQGFVVKWLVEKYINGGLPRLPFLKCGFYPWSDGAKPRATDDFQWNCPQDVIPDGIHSSQIGSEKLARAMFKLLMRDPCASRMFGGIARHDGGSAPGTTTHV